MAKGCWDGPPCSSSWPCWSTGSASIPSRVIAKTFGSICKRTGAGAGFDGGGVSRGYPSRHCLESTAQGRQGRALHAAVQRWQHHPSLAVLAIALSVLGIGAGPAIFALFLASLLPIVRNTYEGLKNVPASLKEAATGIGMTARQQLWQVELPNAVPIIVGGVRVALALNVGTAPGLPDRRQQPGQPDLPRHRPEQPAATVAGRSLHGLAGTGARCLGEPFQQALAGTRPVPIKRGNQ